MSLVNLKFPCVCAATSRQGGRAENQDAYGFCDTKYGSLLLVCDGMGGGPGGRTASNLLVQTILRVMSEINEENRVEALKKAICIANDVLLRKQTEFPELLGMGSTLTALLINKQSAIIAHIGDSRVYRLRNSSKSFRTLDHSKVGELVRAGMLTEEQARLSAESNIITRVMGRKDIAIPEIEEVDFERGDRFVLCSDGIWGMMPEPELIKKCSAKQNLVSLTESIAYYVDNEGVANGGHHDNLTIAILEPKIDSKYKEPMNRKSRYILYALSAVLVVSVLYNLFLNFQLAGTDKSEGQIKELVACVDSLKHKNAALEDTIKTIRANAEQMRKDIEKGGESYAKELLKANAELTEKIKTIEAEKIKLQDLLNKAQKPAPTTTSKKSQTAQNNVLAVLKNKITDLKNTTGKSQTECAQKAVKRKNEIIKIIEEELKKQSNQSAKLKEIKGRISQKWDTNVIGSGNKWTISPVAQKEIESIINLCK